MDEKLLADLLKNFQESIEQNQLMLGIIESLSHSFKNVDGSIHGFNSLFQDNVLNSNLENISETTNENKNKINAFIDSQSQLIKNNKEMFAKINSISEDIRKVTNRIIKVEDNLNKMNKWFNKEEFESHNTKIKNLIESFEKHKFLENAEIFEESIDELNDIDVVLNSEDVPF